jgi:hypothetical protein
MHMTKQHTQTFLNATTVALCARVLNSMSPLLLLLLLLPPPTPPVPRALQTCTP